MRYVYNNFNQKSYDKYIQNDLMFLKALENFNLNEICGEKIY